MNTGRTAVTLIEFIAEMPWAGEMRCRPGITKLEKAKNTPPITPQPMAAASRNQWFPESSNVVMGSTQDEVGETVHRREATIHSSASRLLAVDALAGLLEGPRARGAFLLRSLLDPPWGLRIQDGAPLTLVAVVRGDAWVVRDDGEHVLMRPGDVAIIRGPDPYTVADDPATPADIVIHPGQRSTTRAGEELCAEMDLGVRTWGTNPDGATMMLTGTYEFCSEVSQRLLDVLPPLIVLGAGEWDCPLIGLLSDEMAKDEQGQAAVLDRLLDLLLIAVLRTWFTRQGEQAPAWYTAHQDPVVGRALRLLQNNPAESWTVASLAAATGVSRAGFARRFSDVVGEPPIAFLTDLAPGDGRRPAARHRPDGGGGGPPGRLPEPVHLQHGVQAGLRRQPQGAPRRLRRPWRARAELPS